MMKLLPKKLNQPKARMNHYSFSPCAFSGKMKSSCQNYINHQPVLTQDRTLTAIFYKPNHQQTKYQKAQTLPKLSSRNSFQKNYSKTSLSQIKRGFANVDRGEGAVENEWFKTDEQLKKLRESSSPHFCFLEGPVGSGKTDIISRLGRIGYSTISLPFIPYHIQHGLSDASDKWWVDLRKKVLGLQDKTGFAPKGNIVFVKRSGLTPVIYSERDYLLDEMILLENRISSSVILAMTEAEIGELRVQGRFELEPVPEFKEARIALGERKDLKPLYARYLEAWQDDAFDGRINTTSTKQAVVGLLKLYGLEFNPQLKFPADL